MADAIPSLARARVRTRDQWRCVRCGLPTEPGHWHHRRSRSVRDDCQHATCNGVTLCPTCHSWVHAHPFESRSQGWIVSRHSQPCEMPVFNQSYGWVLLDHEGQMRQVKGGL